MLTNTLIIIIVCLVLVLVGVAFLFYADIMYYFVSRRIRKIERKNYERLSLLMFAKELVAASKRMIETGKRIEYPILEADTFIGRCRYFITNGNRALSFSFIGSESGWLLHALFEYLDDVKYVQAIFDDKILSVPIKYIEQSQCGMVALSLYKKTNISKYKSYSDNLYEYLCSQDTDYGIVFREIHKGNRILVDTLGMAIPFLIEYGRTFGNRNAIKLAEKSFEQYIKYGVDNDTGIPAFAFRVPTPHVKLGSPNWGRGVAWYVIGLMYVEDTNLSSSAQHKIKLFEEGLVNLWTQENSFGHFLGEGGRDLSAELPILQYLYNRNIINLSKDDISKYSTMSCHGLMYHSSSSNVGIVRYGTCAGPNVLSQAFMLRLITTYRNKMRGVTSIS